MKKILLLTAISSLFFATSAFAHCGSCGTDHEAAAKECCGTDGKCCHAKKDCEEKKACKEECKKECCAKKEKAAETAAAAKKEGACCPAKA